MTNSRRLRHLMLLRGIQVLGSGQTEDGGDTPVGPDAFTQLLMHMDGANGSTVFTDESANALAFSATGAAALTTAEMRFGTASLGGLTSSGRIQTSATGVFAFGASDFTVEFFVKWPDATALSGLNTFIINHYDNTNTGNWYIQIFSNNIWFGYYNGSIMASGNRAWSYTHGIWYHVAAVRQGTTARLYVDGTQAGTDITLTTPDFAAFSTRPLVIGNRQAGDLPCNAFVDEVRVSNTARYTGNFTPPSAPFS